MTKKGFFAAAAWMAVAAVMLAGCAKKGGDETPAAEYTIKVSGDANGSAKATVDGIEVTKAKKDAVVKLEASPAALYKFKEWSVKDNAVELTDKTANPATFTMPAAAVEITASFAPMTTEDFFPDANFRKWVLDNYDTDKDGAMSATERTALADVLTVELSGSGKDEGEKIASLKGIEYFTGLKDLKCDNNLLTALNLRANTALTDFYCDNNQLTALNVLANPLLEILDCDNNNLSTLDVSANTALTYLDCSDNNLTALDVTANTALQMLTCGNGAANPLWVTVPEGTVLGNGDGMLDISAHDGGSDDLHITEFGPTGTQNGVTVITKGWVFMSTAFPDPNFRAWVAENYDINSDEILSPAELAVIAEITNMVVDGRNKPDTEKIADLTGIEHFTSLMYLYCEENLLTKLDLSKNTALTSLLCYNNQLTKLDVSKNTKLSVFYCNNNQLSKLDMSANTALTWLTCSNNQLTELDLTENSALNALYCHNNQLTALDVSQNALLQNIYCAQNKIPTLDLSKHTGLKQVFCGNGRDEIFATNVIVPKDMPLYLSSYLINAYSHENNYHPISKFGTEGTMNGVTVYENDTEPQP